jgi:uncharacterized protein (UPF0276 family)
VRWRRSDPPFLDSKPRVGWVEVHSENYLNGPALAVLEAVRTDYPVSLHSVGLSLGSAQGVDGRHLARVVTLAERLDPGLMSEHLAWGAVDHDFLADLLPLPLTEESLDVVCHNVDTVQTALRRRILMENPSTYLQFKHSTIPEPEFLAALAARTGCGLICDVNNIFVSATNHGWDAAQYLRSLPAEAIGEFHLGGHSAAAAVAPLLLDTHDAGCVVTLRNGCARHRPTAHADRMGCRDPGFARTPRRGGSRTARPGRSHRGRP